MVSWLGFLRVTLTLTLATAPSGYALHTHPPMPQAAVNASHSTPTHHANHKPLLFLYIVKKSLKSEFVMTSLYFRVLDIRCRMSRGRSPVFSENRFDFVRPATGTTNIGEGLKLITNNFAQ